MTWRCPELSPTSVSFSGKCLVKAYGIPIIRELCTHSHFCIGPVEIIFNISVDCVPSWTLSLPTHPKYDKYYDTAIIGIVEDNHRVYGCSNWGMRIDLVFESTASLVI